MMQHGQPIIKNEFYVLSLASLVQGVS